MWNIAIVTTTAVASSTSSTSAKRSVPWRCVRGDPPVARALLGVAPKALTPLAILLDLLEEGLFDLRDALPHPHGLSRR